MNPLDSCRVMFVLGAGASAPLGMPTTLSLMKRLEGQTRLGRLAAEIHKSAAYRFRIPPDNINIEVFVEHLHELQLLLWLARRSELPTLLPGFTANAPVLEQTETVLRELNLRAYQLLHRLCGDCSGAKVHALWEPILAWVSGVQAVVPIFTLNYDWTFEKLAIENQRSYALTDGFELLGGRWDAERFTKLRPSRKKINLALFKLHGSTNWLPDGVKSLGRFEVGGNKNDIPSDDMPPHQFEMVYPGHAHELWLGKQAWQRLSDPSGMFGSWMERDPYKTLYGYFHQAVRRVALIVVIGYAFHDERINQEIIRASRHAKIIVLDPGGPGLSRRGETGSQPPFSGLEFFDRDTRWSHFLWIGAKFGPSTTTQVLQEKMQELLHSRPPKTEK